MHNWYTIHETGDYGLKALLANLMALLITVHAVCGCCWHHAHARTLNSHSQGLTAHELADAIAQSHECGGSPSHAADNKPADCKDLPCVYIGALSIKTVAPDLSALPQGVQSMPCLNHLPEAALAAGRTPAVYNLPPPIPLNLAYAVLLI
jgi:hypothetical protein